MRNAPYGNQNGRQTLIEERKSDLGERLLWHVAAFHWTVKESTLVNQSTLGKGSQRGTNKLFYTKWPRKERIVWRQFIANHTVSGNY